MSDSPWKPERKFMVIRPIILPNPIRNYIPGILYEVAKFGMIRVAHDPFRGRVASQFWQSSESERYLLLQNLQWEDEKPSKVSNGLRRFIEQSPESKFVRGFVRQEMGIVPEKDKTPTTAEGWFEYIDKTEVVARPAGAKLSANGAQQGEPTLPIEVEGTQLCYGSANFSRVDTWNGIIEVPVGIIDRGRDDIVRFIRENFEDYLEREYGETDYGDTQDDESESLRIRVSDIDRVISQRGGQIAAPAAPVAVTAAT